jgi:hypothetical protein
MKLFLIFSFVSALLAEDVFYYQESNIIHLTKTISLKRNTKVTQYKTSKEMILSTTDELIVKFKADNGILDCANKYTLVLIKKIDTNIYLFRVATKEQLFETIEKLREENSVKYVHPNFTKKSYLR